MDKNKLVTNIIIVVLVLVALFLAYRWWSSRETDDFSSGQSQAYQINQELLVVLDSLRDISLDSSSLLGNKIFSGQLKDYSLALPKRAVGRTNPFATID